MFLLNVDESIFQWNVNQITLKPNECFFQTSRKKIRRSLIADPMSWNTFRCFQRLLTFVGPKILERLLPPRAIRRNVAVSRIFDWCLLLWEISIRRNRFSYTVERDDAIVWRINLEDDASRCLIRFSLPSLYHNLRRTNNEEIGSRNAWRKRASCLFRLFGLEFAHWF